MPKSKTKEPKETKETKDSKGGSKSDTTVKSDSKTRIVEKSRDSDAPPKTDGKKASRARHMERVEMLARPTARRLQSLWDEKCSILPAARRDKIKSALEEDYFLSPEQTEQYFQALGETTRRWTGTGVANVPNTKEDNEKIRELRQRQKWLINFSAQVAYHLCDYIAKGQKEMLVSNRLRSIADVVLERVAEILGEPKPSRSHPGRLARFMVAISDRIAVWIENAVYRADAIEPKESSIDEHMKLDRERPLV